MEEDYDMFLSGTIEGDYSELFNNVVAFIKANGSVVDGNWAVDSEDIMQKISITVNNDTVASLYFWEGDPDVIDANTDAVSGSFQLRANSAYYERSIIG